MYKNHRPSRHSQHVAKDINRSAGRQHAVSIGEGSAQVGRKARCTAANREQSEDPALPGLLSARLFHRQSYPQSLARQQKPAGSQFLTDSEGKGCTLYCTASARRAAEAALLLLLLYRRPPCCSPSPLLFMPSPCNSWIRTTTSGRQAITRLPTPRDQARVPVPACTLVAWHRTGDSKNRPTKIVQRCTLMLQMQMRWAEP